MKIFKYFVVLFLIVPLHSKAMELNVDELNEKAEILQKQRDDIYNDTLESGPIFLTIFNEHIAKKPVIPPSDSAEFNKILSAWKAVTITRQLLKLQKRFNQLKGIEVPKNISQVQTLKTLANDKSSFMSRLPTKIIETIIPQLQTSDPAQNSLEVQSLDTLMKDPTSFISRLPIDILNTIREDLVEHDEAVSLSLKIFARSKGNEVSKFMQPFINNLQRQWGIQHIHNSNSQSCSIQ